MKPATILLLTLALILPLFAFPQGQMPSSQTSTYQPKFAGDKAHSNAEAVALGYMRTIVAAQKDYKKRHDKYASSLMALVGNGSFTKRMVDTKRGDYTVSFRPRKDGYSLALTPNQFDSDHRAFYVDESGVFRCELDKPATTNSPVLE